MAVQRYTSVRELPAEVLAGLSRHVSNVGGRTYAIFGLPPELTGGSMARYSRAATGLQLTLANEFLDEFGEPREEKGTELMDRVLNAFGDESVGELEGAHVGIEDISQLMTKTIEDRRIGGSPIEQSTRYVVYDQKDEDGRWRYLRPVEVMRAGKNLNNLFERANDRAFEVYAEGVGRLKDFFKRQFPKNRFTINIVRDGEVVEVHESDLQGQEEERAFRNAYNFTIRCAALDVGRCVLPASTLTHLGVYGNGRYFTNLITAFKSGELTEERVRGLELERALNTQIPTFIKRNRANPEVAEINHNMRELSQKLLGHITPEADKVTLVSRGKFIDEVTSLALFPYTNISLEQIMGEVREMPMDMKLGVLNTYKGHRESRRDRTGRSLEAGYPIVYDLVGGFAEYRDLERHRMLTQQRQLLSPNFGFIMPPEMGEIGIDKEVEEVVEGMESLYESVKEARGTVVAQYATLFNHRMRFMMGMNSREFQHLSELRTQPAGHFSYRAMVMEMADMLFSRDHWMQGFCEFIDRSDPGNKMTRAKEQSRIAGKNLVTGVEGGVDLE